MTANFQSLQRKTSVSFRRFNRHHASLSTVYWTHKLGALTIQKHLINTDLSKWSVATLGVSLQESQFAFSAGATLDSLDGYLDTCRLHILAICLAHLESFLKDAAYCVAKVRDPHPIDFDLSPVAKALVAPILEVDSLPRPLEYAKHLFEINIDNEASAIAKAYAYRCALVHNGGYATKKALKNLDRKDLRLHEKLSISWEELKGIMAAVHSVAEKIDSKWCRSDFQLAECERELGHLRHSRHFPKKASDLWQYIHDQGFRLPPKVKRSAWERQLYAKKD